MTIIDTKSGQAEIVEDTDSRDQLDKYQQLRGQSIGPNDEINIPNSARIEFVITDKERFVGEDDFRSELLKPFIRDVQADPGARIRTVDGRVLRVVNGEIILTQP